MWVRRAVRDLGRDGAQSRGAARVGRSSVLAGLFIVGGFLALSIVALTHATHAPWHPFAAPGRCGRERPRRRALDRALELHRVGQCVHGAGRGEGRVAQLSARAGDRAAARRGRLPRAACSPRSRATDWTTWREGGWPQIALAAGGSAGSGARRVDRRRRNGERAGVVQRAAARRTRAFPSSMAEDGLLPAALARTDARGTPRNRRARRGGLLLGVHAAAVQRPGRRRRAALLARADARVGVAGALLRRAASRHAPRRRSAFRCGTACASWLSFARRVAAAIGSAAARRGALSFARRREYGLPSRSIWAPRVCDRRSVQSRLRWRDAQHSACVANGRVYGSCLTIRGTRPFITKRTSRIA